jgi:hypothetical protein
MEPPRWPWHALTVVLDLALSATYENDLKQVENVNRLVAAEVDSKHRQIACQVISPSEETDLSRIIRYEPDFSAGLIQMGYDDTKEKLKG